MSGVRRRASVDRGKLGGHLLLQLLSLLGGNLGEVLAAGGVDDASGGVHKQSAVPGHAVAADFLQRAALGADTGNEQEMVGGHLADILKHTTLRSTNDIHHILVVSPLLALFQHFLKESLATGILCQLKVVRAFIARQRQQDHPFAIVAEERRHAVFTHVGSNGEGVDVVLFEEGFGVHLRRVADITAFGISNDEVVGVFLFQVVDSSLKGKDAVYTIGLIEGKVRFVGDTIGGSGVDDEGVELTEGAEEIIFAVFLLRLVDDALGYLVDVRIKSNTEETLLLADLLY